jgi:hypothetical protein
LLLFFVAKANPYGVQLLVRPCVFTFDEEKSVPLRSSAVLTDLGTDEDDALVVAVQAFDVTAGDKERKRRIEWEVSTLAQLSNDPNSTLFQLHTNFLAKTGLPSQKLLLYCRPTFHEQFNFLRERVINNCVLGWILGPPGTGKSTTALAFASTLYKNDWIVTWMHLSRSKYPECVRL